MKIHLAVALVLISTIVSSQEKAADPNLCTVSGTVIKEPGSLPLKKAIVMLVAQKPGPRVYTSQTDADGQFTISNIVPGSYQMFTEKTGFVEVNNRKRKLESHALTLSPGQHVDDFRFTMLMTSAIVGRVVDEDGDPLANAQVNAFRKRYGKSQWEQSKSERTNDLGEYRLPGLFPGRYYLSATPAPDFRSFTNVPSEIPAPNSDSDPRQAITYYPNTPDRHQASPIELRSGDDFPVNFTILPSRTYTIHGVVVSPPSNRTTSVVLNAREYGQVFYATEPDKEGRFELRGVAPGSYDLKVFTYTSDGSFRTARQRIDVVSRDISDVRLAPARSAKITGQVLVDNQKSFPECHLRLRDLDDEDHILDFDSDSGISNRYARANLDGTFELKNIPPGKYLIEAILGAESRAYYVRSVRFNGSPADSGFTINGADASLLVTLNPDSAELKGSALDEHDKPVTDATVVLVPDEPFRKTVIRYGKAHTDQNGQFVLSRITPGSYTLYAWQDLDGEPYLDPDFLKTQQDHGVSIRVNPGSSNAAITLHAFPAPDDAN